MDKKLRDIGSPPFSSYMAEKGTKLKRKQAGILQLNIGLYCNQACTHCHVDSSPQRTEMMTLETAQQCIKVLDNSPSIHTIDLTGGAPELNIAFRYLVEEARKRGKKIIDRCNLSVLLEPGQEDLLEFLKENKVSVVASLPCYTEDNVDAQRGDGIFAKSILALQMLNQAGYGLPGSDLELDLVYNPGGAFLPGSQGQLESDYKKKLMDDFGIEFHRLFTITNMPIKRFADSLIMSGKFEEYMTLLVNSFNPSAVENVMCTDTINVSWDGSIYDCDFNQQLGMGIGGSKTVSDLMSTDDVIKVPIAVGDHCYGCTAGEGSSCQGALV